ncbi:HipA domain-containing protein [uncultured Fibrobacter sp.]|uniref:HipA domain-containing protein n=1 Tax=uncultured Fibrobacter sp. TaxID=261512 RepID=UPI0025FE502F|nr:HipA domain-containing protein [uncultured Fibrobacter sp.]
MRCHCCLKETENDFCRSCSQRLFSKANFSAMLKFTLPSIAQGTNQNTRRISISGAQAKYSLRIKSKELEPTDNNGTYILKPSTNMQFRLFADMPANEHITMQMAKQIFKLNVAESALLQFTTGEYTYLTKRFDIRSDGSKILQEDLAQTAGLSSDANGSNFKYESLSYEEIAYILKQHVSASPIAIEQFFKVLLFNYLVCNGDAHIKNFSIYSPHQDGVYELTPAYDLINTSLHADDFRTALDLFKDEENYNGKFFKDNGFYGASDFLEFARRIGIVEKRAQKFILDITAHIPEMDEMLDKSFLSDEAKVLYKERIRDRAKALSL